MKTMKLTNKFAATAFAALALVFATSCSSETEDEETPKGGEETPVEDTNLSGTLSKDRTLDASKAYTVTGAYLVAEGATLTIPAGTKITSEKGSVSDQKYIAVLKGGKINVNGEAGNPVVMKGQGGSGDWGGLLVCGNAKTTKGVDATAEVGGLKYGGTDNADNSGSIKYLVIEDAGAQINDDSQFNGLTLYAVGSATVVKNITVINGEDDGIEFFGGAVNASDITLKDNADDSIDWTEGWNGTLTNTSVEFSAGFKFSTAIEGDGSGSIEFPTVTNFKAVAADADAGIGLQFKNDSNAVMTKFTLTNFAPQFDLNKKDADKNSIPTTNADLVAKDLKIDGVVVTQEGTYNTSTL